MLRQATYGKSDATPLKTRNYVNLAAMKTCGEERRDLYESVKFCRKSLVRKGLVLQTSDSSQNKTKWYNLAFRFYCLACLRQVKYSIKAPASQTLSLKFAGSSPRMVHCVEFLEAFGLDMGIYLGRREVGVAKHLLHDTQIRPVLKKMGRERMSEDVGRDMLFDTGSEPLLLDHPENILAADSLASPGEEKRLAGGGFGKLDTRGARIVANRPDCSPADGYETLLGALAHAGEVAEIEVDGVKVEGAELGDAKPATVEKFHNRPVAARKRALGRPDLNEIRNILLRKGFRQTAARFGSGNTLHETYVKHAGIDCETRKRPESANGAGDRPAGVGGIEESEVILDGCAGYGGEVENVVFAEVIEELPEVAPVGSNSIWREAGLDLEVVDKLSDKSFHTYKSESLAPGLTKHLTGTASEAIFMRFSGYLQEWKMPSRTKKMTKTEAKPYRKKLENQRALLAGDIHQMGNEALKKNRQEASGDLSNMPVHLADVSSDNYEQELTLELMENKGESMSRIEKALNKIEEGEYGLCEECGKRIKKARLEAIPYAEHCISCQANLEQEKKRM